MVSDKACLAATASRLQRLFGYEAENSKQLRQLAEHIHTKQWRRAYSADQIPEPKLAGTSLQSRNADALQDICKAFQTPTSRACCATTVMAFLNGEPKAQKHILMTHPEKIKRLKICNRNMTDIPSCSTLKQRPEEITKAIKKAVRKASLVCSQVRGSLGRNRVLLHRLFWA